MPRRKCILHERMNTYRHLIWQNDFHKNSSNQKGAVTLISSKCITRQTALEMAHEKMRTYAGKSTVIITGNDSRITRLAALKLAPLTRSVGTLCWNILMRTYDNRSGQWEPATWHQTIRRSNWDWAQLSCQNVMYGLVQIFNSLGLGDKDEQELQMIQGI